MKTKDYTTEALLHQHKQIIASSDLDYIKTSDLAKLLGLSYGAVNKKLKNEKNKDQLQEFLVYKDDDSGQICGLLPEGLEVFRNLKHTERKGLTEIEKSYNEAMYRKDHEIEMLQHRIYDQTVFIEELRKDKEYFKARVEELQAEKEVLIDERSRLQAEIAELKMKQIEEKEAEEQPQRGFWAKLLGLK